MGSISSLPAKRFISVAGALLDIDGLVCLHGAAASTKYSVPKDISSSTTPAAAYTPSGAKKLMVLAIRMMQSVAASRVDIGYGDTNVGNDAAAAPTNSVIFGNSAWSALWITPASFTVKDAGVHEFGCKWIIPNGKYLYVAGTGGAGAATFYGYEID